jgi:hypothetical protein
MDINNTRKECTEDVREKNNTHNIRASDGKKWRVRYN